MVWPPLPRPLPQGEGGSRAARAVVALLLVLAIAGCSQASRYGGLSPGAIPYDGTDPAAEGRTGQRAPRRYYAPPGPASDPWAPYIHEAAGRFRVPEQWVRAVMRQESGGREQAVSPVGAMGLMQVMPATYAGLRARHNLGEDPYDPRNNILAGTAYIREMFDRYGAPGFLAAYNAGPDRLDQYLAGATALPDETVNYLAAITPNLGTAVPLSGPLVAYAAAEPAPQPTRLPDVASLASGCDPNAAYDPDRPCATLERAATAPTVLPVAARIVPAAGQWGVQVGAFQSLGLAHAVAEGARAEALAELRAASVALPPTSPFGGAPLYRARLVGVSADAANTACQRLNARQLPCVVVRPEQS